MSTSCADSATSRRTTSRPAKASAAFAALLRGADLAEKLGAPREAADLLARAADLWEVAADATDTVGHARLLERAGDACGWVGRAQEGYRLLRAARDLVSPERDPLWASRLTRRVAETAFSLGETSDRHSRTCERAVELSGVDPDSREHAEALAQLANALWWDGRTEEARRLVEDAVAAAHRSGSAAAISSAHGIRATAVDGDRPRAGRPGRDGLLGARAWPRAIPRPSATRTASG